MFLFYCMELTRGWKSFDQNLQPILTTNKTWGESFNIDTDRSSDYTVTRTFLRILANLINSLLWTVLIIPQISSSPSFKTPTVVSIIVTFMFYCFLSFLFWFVYVFAVGFFCLCFLFFGGGWEEVNSTLFWTSTFKAIAVRLLTSSHRNHPSKMNKKNWLNS